MNKSPNKNPSSIRNANRNASPNKNQFEELAASACQYPPKTIDRQRYLDKLVRAVARSRKLWWENVPYYEDALQQTWLYLARNLCEAITAKKAYDPEIASVTTWLNHYLKNCLKDLRRKEAKERSRRAIELVSESGERINPAEDLPAPPPADLKPLEEAIREWAEGDVTGDLRRIHVRNHPQVNCQVLILRRLPPETTWDNLAAEFNLPRPTIHSFYRRQCKPRLQEFVTHEGYL